MSTSFKYYLSNERHFSEKRGALILGRRSLNILRHKKFFFSSKYGISKYFAFHPSLLCRFVLLFNFTKKFQNDFPTGMGFEPTRAEPNGLAVHRLNHSATPSITTGESN